MVFVSLDLWTCLAGFSAQATGCVNAVSPTTSSCGLWASVIAAFWSEHLRAPHRSQPLTVARVSVSTL